MPSARVFGPWPAQSNPAASCLQWSCALQAEAVDTFFFFACAHLTRGRCCTSNLIAPCINFASAHDEEDRETTNGPCCRHCQGFEAASLSAGCDAAVPKRDFLRGVRAMVC